MHDSDLDQIAGTRAVRLDRRGLLRGAGVGALALGSLAAASEALSPTPAKAQAVDDAVIANYHDQGHIPVKLLGFDVDPATGKWNDLSGVNITLGLPIIRTSVDHGTAFDIAGQGLANEQSLVEAIEYAERLATPQAAQARREQAA